MAKSTSGSCKDKDNLVKDLTTSFFSILDNQDVIAKLSQALAVSFQLILDEKIKPVVAKLDEIIKENKTLTKKISDMEKENVKLKKMNDEVSDSVWNLKQKVNSLEQESRKNSLIISGIPESFAERVSDASTDDSVPITSREDTVATVCKMFHETCNITVTASDIQHAFRIKSRGDGPRRILVTFYSPTLRQSAMCARRSLNVKKLVFRNNTIYLNEYLTELNSKLSYKAREVVKSHHAFATWITNDQIFLKWSETSRPIRLHKIEDLNY
jgi:hypothetical protein